MLKATREKIIQKAKLNRYIAYFLLFLLLIMVFLPNSKEEYQEITPIEIEIETQKLDIDVEKDIIEDNSVSTVKIDEILLPTVDSRSSLLDL